MVVNSERPALDKNLSVRRAAHYQQRGHQLYYERRSRIGAD